jgi:PilZ domain-containing protein
MTFGRKEKRSQQNVEVILSTVGEHPMLGESASMENISSYGLRVRTERPWKPNTPVLFKSSQGDWLRARVIYCQSLDAKSFAVGLELPASGRALDAEKDWELTMRYRCPACGRGYAVVEWKKNPKCRQCGTVLRPDDEQRKSLQE